MLFKLRLHLYFIYFLHKGLATAKSQGVSHKRPMANHPAAANVDCSLIVVVKF